MCRGVLHTGRETILAETSLASPAELQLTLGIARQAKTASADVSQHQAAKMTNRCPALPKRLRHRRPPGPLSRLLFLCTCRQQCLPPARWAGAACTTQHDGNITHQQTRLHEAPTLEYHSTLQREGASPHETRFINAPVQLWVLSWRCTSMERGSGQASRATCPFLVKLPQLASIPCRHRGCARLQSDCRALGTRISYTRALGRNSQAHANTPRARHWQQPGTFQPAQKFR